MAIQEKLGSSCLLVAQNTLEGLNLKPKELNAESRMESEGSGRLEVEQVQSTGEGKPEPEEPVPNEPSISYLSCSGVSLQSTLSETVDRTAHLKGQ